MVADCPDGQDVLGAYDRRKARASQWPKWPRGTVSITPIVRYTGRVSTPRDEASPDLPGWIADRLASARADAQRVADELVRDGHVTSGEIAALAAAVDDAVERGRVLIGDALREPRRILAGLRQAAAQAEPRPDGAPGASSEAASTDAAARIARLDARVAALEALVAGPKGARGEGEGF